MKLLIHTTEGQTTEIDLTDVRAIEIKTDELPLFELRPSAERVALQVSIHRAGVGLAIRPVSSNSVELRPGDV